MFWYSTSVSRLWYFCFASDIRPQSEDSGVSVSVLILDSSLQTLLSLSLFCYSTLVYRLQCLCLCSDTQLRSTDSSVFVFVLLFNSDSGVSVFVLLLDSSLQALLSLSLFWYSTPTPVSLSLFWYFTPVYRLWYICLCSATHSLWSTDSGASVFVLLLDSGLYKLFLRQDEAQGNHSEYIYLTWTLNSAQLSNPEPFFSYGWKTNNYI